MNQYKSFLSVLALCGALLPGVVLTSCDDDDVAGDRTFAVEGIDTENGNCIELFVSQSGKGYHKNQDGLQLSSAYTYSIRTKSHWMIIPKTEDTSWIRFISTEGHGDSKFFFGVWPNTTFDTRIADFSLVLDGVEQPHTFIHIEQAPTLPTFSLEDGNLYAIPDTGGEVTVDITTNTGECGYEIEYPDKDVGEWLTFVADKSKPKSFVFSAQANSSADEREAYVTVYSKLFPDLKARVQIIQNTYALVMFEDFSILNATSSTQIWNQTNARPIEQWTGDAAALGWVGLHNGSRASSYVYACKGYIRLANDGYIGTVASPAFKKLGDKTADVNVTFDCVGYVSESGVRDYSDIYIGVWGPGTVEGANQELKMSYKELGGATTLSVRHIEVTNFPNVPVGVFPAGYDEWNSENARQQVRVNGVTAETRLIIMAGCWENKRSTNKYDSPDPVQNGVTYRRNNKNNRIGIDNFKVLQIIK